MYLSSPTFALRAKVGLMRGVLALCALMACVARQGYAQEQEEYPVKAAFVLNFMKFTELDQSTNDQIDLCVLGSAAVAEAFHSIDGQAVHGRSVAVRAASDASSLSDCEVVFLAASSNLSSKQLLSKLQSGTALSVGEKSDFLQEGGIIRVFVRDGSVKFAIAPVNAQQVGLSLSSKLLALAEIYKN